MIPSWRNVPELCDRHKLTVLVAEEGSALMIAEPGSVMRRVR